MKPNFTVMYVDLGSTSSRRRMPSKRVGWNRTLPQRALEVHLALLTKSEKYSYTLVKNSISCFMKL